MKLLEVNIWNQLVGVLVWDERTQSCHFEYSPKFIDSGLELSPIINPTNKGVITSKNSGNNHQLMFDSFKGLPLFISDSLPDKFGTELLSKFLEKKGKNFRDLDPIEKLSYIGRRGMGALEFVPSKDQNFKKQQLDLRELNHLSNAIIKNEPIGNLNNLSNLFHVGTSPGGAQPKVLVNIDSETGDIFRGDSMPEENQESWILKFNRDTGDEIDSEKGKIEYIYYLIAKEAKINVMNSTLFHFEKDSFFMTKRFDRLNNSKIHTQTLHALAGMNYMLPNTYSYEQIFTVFNQLRLDYRAKEQLFRIMLFNVIGRNIDDHTKNFGFNMSANGEWNFSPAYDLTFSYNDNFNRVKPHFLSINGKNDNFKLEDILTIAKEHSIKKPKEIINEVNDSFGKFESFGQEVGLNQSTIQLVKEKLNILPYKITKL